MISPSFVERDAVPRSLDHIFSQHTSKNKILVEDGDTQELANKYNQMLHEAYGLEDLPEGTEYVVIWLAMERCVVLVLTLFF